MMILHLILSAIPLEWQNCAPDDSICNLENLGQTPPPTQVYIQNPSSGGDFAVLIPAILLGAALIAGAIVYSNRKPR